MRTLHGAQQAITGGLVQAVSVNLQQRPNRWPSALDEPEAQRAAAAAEGTQAVVHV